MQSICNISCALSELCGRVNFSECYFRFKVMKKIKNNNFASCAVKTNNFGWFLWTLWTSFEPFFLIFLFLIFSESSKSSRRVFAWRGFSSSATKMASSSGGALKDLVHPNFNEALKTHNSVSFKLVKTGEL